MTNRAKDMGHGVFLFSPYIKFGDVEYGVLEVTAVESKPTFLEQLVGEKETCFIAFRTTKGAPVHNVEGSDIAAALKEFGYEITE